MVITGKLKLFYIFCSNSIHITPNLSFSDTNTRTCATEKVIDDVKAKITEKASHLHIQTTTKKM